MFEISKVNFTRLQRYGDQKIVIEEKNSVPVCTLYNDDFIVQTVHLNTEQHNFKSKNLV